MSTEKSPAPAPEIPDELRASLGKPKRPAGFTPRTAEAEEDNAPDETKRKAAPRDLKKFWIELAKVLEKKQFVVEAVKGQKGMQKRQVFTIGADGMPYPAYHVSQKTLDDARARKFLAAPALSPTFGDLTPEFVEWLYLNHPEDAATRYFARITHVSQAALDRSTP